MGFVGITFKTCMCIRAVSSAIGTLLTNSMVRDAPTPRYKGLSWVLAGWGLLSSSHCLGVEVHSEGIKGVRTSSPLAAKIMVISDPVSPV